jgi:alpha-2-macroglobulin
MSTVGWAALARRSLLVVALYGVLAVAGCAKPPAPVALPAVSPLPSPNVPAWVVQISPTGQADHYAQIRVIFARPLIPLQAIESPDQQSKLAYFTVTPALAGRFRFLTPRMVGFQADQALPLATRVKVVVRAGLIDLDGDKLDNDIAWTFTTQPISLGGLPTITEDTNPVGPRPTFSISANTELDAASLERHAHIKTANGSTTPISVKLQKQPTPVPGADQSRQNFDPSARPWVYDVTPDSALEKGKTYTLEFSPGIVPAHGNLASADSFSGAFKVYGPLTFAQIAQDVEGRGRFTNSPVRLEFNNPLNADSALKNLSLTPAPKGAAALFSASDDSRFVYLNEDALEPATTYTITIGPGLTDSFGQTFGSSKAIEHKTGDLVPNLFAPAGFFVFPADDNLQLDFWAVNLPQRRLSHAFKKLQPADLVYFEPSYGDFGNTFFGNWSELAAAGAVNEPSHFGVPLRQLLEGRTGVLAYGVRGYVGGTQPNKEIDGAVQLTNLGIFAQWFPESGMVHVNHLSDGSPAAGAHVEIWPSRLDDTGRSTATACATAIAGANGTAMFDAASLRGCMGGSTTFAKAPALLTVVREGSDWAYTRTLEYSGAYDYDMDAEWTGDPQSRGAIFSDRQLYQPGESAWFTGEAYYLVRGQLVRDASATYKVTLQDPNGGTSSAGSVTTNAYGTFSLQVHLRPNQPLGYYTIEAIGSSGRKIDGTFRVAEFKPPNFKVELTLDKEFATPGQSVGASAKSTYLFGAPVQGGSYKFYVTRQQTAFTPKGWDEYTFGRQWFWPEQPPSVPSDVTQSAGTIGADGTTSQTVKVTDDLPYPMAYRVDMETTDASNLSVADSKIFTGLPTDKLIGLQGDFIAQTSAPFPVKVIVTDPHGAAKEGERVHLVLQSVEYSSVTQLVEGSSTDRWQAQYKTVAETDVSSGADAQTATLTPPKSGIYRIRANFADAKDDATATDLQLWAWGSEMVNWGNENPGRLTIRLDRKTYKPGDRATALIQSPYPAGELYFAVVRYGTIYHSLTRVNGSAPRVSFTVTPAMGPNAAIQAVLVRQGTPLAKSVPDDLDSLSRTGFAPLTVDLGGQRLKVTLAPAKAKLQPGERQTVGLQMRDAQGHPVQGQFTVMVVNEAILQLSGYRPPDMLDTVFALQPIPTRFSDNRPDVVLRPFASPLQKGWGYGGGESAAAAGTRVRTNFQPLAYYKGALITDASGKGSVTFTLPDDLTTWRVLAVATSGSGAASSGWRFGGGDATFIASKPLLTNPVLPQFARPGDRFDAGLSVTNADNLSGQLSIEAALSGPLHFVINGQQSQSTTSTPTAQTGTQTYRFPMIASGLDKTGVRFTTTLGQLHDAFEVPLEMRTLPITEGAVDAGATDTSATVPLSVDANVDSSLGGLEVELASTLLPEFTAPAKAVLDADEDLPFLQPITSRLLITANLQILATRDGQIYPGFHPVAAAHADVQRLGGLQQADGGFASWPGAKQSDPWVSPNAGQALGRMREAGLAVDQPMVDHLKAYLKKNLANPYRDNMCMTRWCADEIRLRSLMALAELGEQRNDYLSEIYDGRDGLDAVSRIRLARYLSRFPQWKTQADALASAVEQSVYETGRNATLNLPQEWGWLSSPTVSQSEALRLFVERHASVELQDKLARSLVAQRVRGAWPNDYDTAAAITALVDYTRGQPANADFTATLTVGGAQRASERFQGNRDPLRTATVPMAQLPKGSSDVVMAKNGIGRLHYVVSYRYRLQGDQPGVLNGLRVTREIRAANQATVLRSLGLAIPADALTLAPAQVFDIGLEIITDHPVDHLVITDPLPAGLEAVDAAFQTSTQYFQAQRDSWQIDYQTIYKDRVVAYADHLAAGVYSFHYLVRSVTPGTYAWPGAEVQLQYAPEEFGRTASSVLVVSP